MSAAPDLTASELIEKASRGELPVEFLRYAAQGFLPIPQEELVMVLAFLAGHDDEEIAESARVSLQELPSRVLLAFARSETALPDQLRALARSSSDPALLEAILRNRVTGDDTIEEMAGNVPSNLQEVIVINQERILRRPSILEALLSNPDITRDIRRRAMEIREEFFEKQQPAAPPRAVPAAPALEEDDDGIVVEDLSPIADLLEIANVQDDAEPTLPIPPDAVNDNIWAQILRMTVGERVQAAFKGNKTVRGILIKERNKLVCSAVIRSPRVNDSEVEAYAAMRNIEEEVLRLIGMKREWMAKYPIMITLIKNPKAPIGVVLPLINRLTLRDLKKLAEDRGVPETIRSASKKLFQLRNKKNA
ncbi:MAG TPA: hypothetical protein VHL58_20670 [Thermoanaerobaculia bacterium]|nr:hypothetical protein [Thermoanaerobaculia bacterium]